MSCKSKIILAAFVAFTICSVTSFQPAGASKHNSALGASTAVPPSRRIPQLSDQQQQNQQRHKRPLFSIIEKNPFKEVWTNVRRAEHASDGKHKADLWSQKYCSLAGLRDTFGTNENGRWGDFDAATARKLYKSLLPVALLELSEVSDVDPEELAPLAYRARLAAKLYARERCKVPARVAANLIDGFRQWRKYGSFDCTGMTYQQVWEKYAKLIEEETGDHDDVTNLICLKIMERSCKSNEMIDRMVLKQNQPDMRQLENVSRQLERDVRWLLNSERGISAQKFRALKNIACVKKKISDLKEHISQRE